MLSKSVIVLKSDQADCACLQGSEEYLPLQFYQDGEQLQLLTGAADSIDINCPIRILHGMRDSIVPYSCSTKLLSCLKAADVHLTLVKVRKPY